MPNAGGEFGLLRPYYGMKLLWDPAGTGILPADPQAKRANYPDTLLREFLDTYYGPAAGPLWDYIVMLHDKVINDNIHMHLYTNPAQGYLPDDIVQRAMGLFDKAEAAVKDDPERLERVRIARMPLSYARLFPRNGYAIEEGRLRWLGDMAPQTEATRFVQRMKKHGFNAVREHSGEPEQMIVLGGVFNSRLEVVSIQNEHLAVDIVPMLAGRILRITDRKTGRCVTAHNVTRCLYFPFAGGLENRVGETFRFSGWIEPATVADRAENAVTLALQTTDGLQMKRTATLPPGRPVLEVATTVTNPGPKPAEVRLRGHLELNLGDLRTTRVKFTNRAGKPIDKDMVAIVEGLREGEHYYDREAPAGSWTLTGSKGLQVTQTFDPDAIDFTWLYAYPEDLGQLDTEIWLKRKVLATGQGITLRQSIEVRPTAP